MRNGFSQKFLTALFHAQENSEIFVILAEISHSGLPSPLRYCNQKRDIVSGGNTYKARDLKFAPPNEYAEQAPQVTLSVDNTDNEISLACFPLATDEPCLVTIKLILKSEPNTVEFTARFKAVEDAHADGEISVFSGSINHGFDQMYPMHAMTPYSHPGLFGKTLDD